MYLTESAPGTFDFAAKVVRNLAISPPQLLPESLYEYHITKRRRGWRSWNERGDIYEMLFYTNKVSSATRGSFY